MITLRQLRKRKLVQWVAAYAATAWVLLQVLVLIGQEFDWSPALLRLITVTLGVGFVVTVVLAWYHGERGSQRVTGSEVAILIVTLALGSGLLWRTAHRPQQALSQASTVLAPPAPAAIPDITKDPSIAVMPFLDLSQAKDQGYLSDGISEELLNLLAKVPKLRVIARTSSFSFRGKDVPIPTIARALHVATVLEGSVQKSGNQMRITVQLIRASDSTQLWSESYDRTLDDIFKVQDEIAAAVVGQLKIKMLGAPPTVRPIDPKAYALILQASFLSKQGSTVDRAQAIALDQQALAIAPGAARAWINLAGVYIAQAGNGERPMAEGQRLAKESVNKALVLDPDNALAHSILGWIKMSFDNDFAMAAQHFQRALELEPTNVTVLGNAAIFVQNLGRLDEAIVLLQYQTVHDPTNPRAYLNIGYTYYAAHQWDQAIASSRTVLLLSPGHAGMHAEIGRELLGKGDAAKALAELQAEPSEALRMSGLPLAYYALGRKAESDAALAKLIANDKKNSAYDIATVLAYRGEADRAFEWLDNAVAYQDGGMAYVAIEPLFARLHSDRRWLPFLRKIGKAPEQLAAIKFNVALPK